MAQADTARSPNPMPDCPLHLSTFGAAALVRPDGELVLAAGKPLALFAFLHATPRRAATREHLCSLLWGDSPPERAHAAFRTTLSRLKTATDALAVEPRTGEIVLAGEVSSDREQFMASILSGHLQQAVEVYRGPYYPDYSDAGTLLFEQWVELERARLQEFFLRAVETLVRRKLAGGQVKEALRQASRSRSLAPESAIPWRLVLESLAGRDPMAARAEAEAFERWLTAAEARPDQVTLRLIQLIREGVAEPAEPTGARSMFADLVGREREFSAVVQAWDQAARGFPRHLHLNAAPGFGKTRLLMDAQSRLKSLGATVVSIRATPGEREIPYALAAELARGLGNAPGAKGVAPTAAAILVELQPALSTILSSSGPRTTGRDSTLHRIQALGEALSSVADERPVALLIDDLHWADRESLRILVALSERLEAQRVLLVTASRRMDRGFSGSETVVSLPALSLADTANLVTSIAAPPDPAWTETIAAPLHQSSGGSPLMMLEGLQLARDRGALEVRDGGWVAGDLARLIAILESAGTLEARIRRLSPEERRLLLVIATVGMPVREDELTRILPPEAQAVRPALERLERTGFLARRDTGWDLVHDEVAASAIALTTPEERASAHRMAGDWLCQSGGDDQVLLTRAGRHLAQAGAETELQKVFVRYLRSARRNGDRSRPSALANHLLGGYASASRVSSVLRSLPLHLRYPTLRYAAAGLAASAVIGATTMALKGSATPSAPVEEFLIYSADDGRGYATARRFQIHPGNWVAGDTIHLREGFDADEWNLEPTNYAPAARPGHRSLAYPRAVADSGVTDLFLKEADGSIRRLTATRGDDVNPTWSPDGSLLAFQTSRWTPPGDEDSDIAILDPATGQVRQITRGPEYDASPQWSPDGTRIAYHQANLADGVRRICWTTVGGLITECTADTPGQASSIVGWRDPERVVVRHHDSQQIPGLSILTLATGKTEGLDMVDVISASVSPGGEWILVTRNPGRRTFQPVTELFSLNAPGLRRPLVAGSRASGLDPVWLPRPPATSAWLLSIQPASEGLVGVPHHMFARGVSPSGTEVPFSRQTLHWRSADSAVATIGRWTGLVQPGRAGSVWLVASAGGWRTDSVLFRISPPALRVTFSEHWTDSTMPAWDRFGTPWPVVVQTPDLGPAFLSNGDNAFDSGAFTKAGFEIAGGLGVEGMFILPVRRPKWQTMRIQLGRMKSASSNGLSLTGCSFAFPIGEGLDQMNLMSMSVIPDGWQDAAPPSLSDGRAHRIRIQIFPDRTCGLAINGKALWRSKTQVPDSFPFRLALFGRTVGARLLVGPLQVWQGVRTDVDWGTLLSERP